MNITPDNMTHIAYNQCFVFGSNQGGRHGKGASATALKWGAILGQSEGLQGHTYGIPTKNASITRTLSIDEIRPYVNRFIAFAQQHPELHFFVTEIGCGFAGMKHEQVAPLFKDCLGMENVSLPSKFIRVLNHE